MSHRTTVMLTLVVVLLALTAGVALAQSGATKQVGLVVSFPDGKTHTEVVTVPADATGLDALQAVKLTITTAEGSFGTSVCKINDTGCSASNCFCDPAHYWAYFHLTNGAWVSSMEGAATFHPANRAVEGFAWSGSDAQYNPTVKPPVYTFDQLLALQTPPVSVPEPGTLLLLGGGIAALAGYARRLRARA